MPQDLFNRRRPNIFPGSHQRGLSKTLDAPTWCIKDILQQFGSFLTHLGKI